MKIIINVISIVLLLVICPKIPAQHVIAKDSLSFCSADNTPFDWQSLSTDKAIIIWNSPPQCSGCEEHIYLFFNTLDIAGCTLFVAHKGVNNALSRKEIHHRIQQILSLSYTPLYYLERNQWSIDENVLQNYQTYPKLMLVQRNSSSVEVLDYADLFSFKTANPDIQPTVKKRIISFLK